MLWLWSHILDFIAAMTAFSNLRTLQLWGFLRGFYWIAIFNFLAEWLVFLQICRCHWSPSTSADWAVPPQTHTWNTNIRFCGFQRELPYFKATSSKFRANACSLISTSKNCATSSQFATHGSTLMGNIVHLKMKEQNIYKASVVV